MKLCANVLGRNIYVRFKFSCMRSSHGLCARARAQLKGNIVNDLFSQVLVPFLCRRIYPIGTSEQQQCYELLNFIIPLDLISSFHDLVASPGNDVRGGLRGTL